MAITIRDIEKHQQMLDDLKALSEKGTASKALVEGGYMALKYHGLYQAETIKNQKLESELRQLKRKVEVFLSAFDGLRGQ